MNKIGILKTVVVSFAICIACFACDDRDIEEATSNNSVVNKSEFTAMLEEEGLSVTNVKAEDLQDYIVSYFASSRNSHLGVFYDEDNMGFLSVITLEFGDGSYNGDGTQYIQSITKDGLSGDEAAYWAQYYADMDCFVEIWRNADGTYGITATQLTRNNWKGIGWWLGHH